MVPIATMPLSTASPRQTTTTVTSGRHLLVGAIAFLTVVDLFATQAVLPVLAANYGVAPSAIGAAVNASTIGMAIAGLAVARLGRGIDRRSGAALSLTVLALPTAFLAVAPDLPSFAALRIAQGLCMATAFSLTLAALAEQNSLHATATIFAAYITGNVASNLFGRLMAASLAQLVGVGTTFFIFAGFNLLGAALTWLALGMRDHTAQPAPLSRTASLWAPLADARLRASFIVGFCILFAFIGTFTYVNFVLVAPPISLGTMSLGLVYLVFVPSIVTTPLAGSLASRMGASNALVLGLGIALAGLPCLLADSLASVLAGLALIGVGTFLAQATTTGFVGRAARSDPSTASGLYLTAYFLGGLAGSFVLGQVFDRWGWTATVVGIGAALAIASLCAHQLRLDPSARDSGSLSNRE